MPFNKSLLYLIFLDLFCQLFKQYFCIQDRVNAGKPTVMIVTTMVSVGTSNGFILMFDGTQTLRLVKMVSH